MKALHIRSGTVADAPVVLGLLDEAVEWLVGRGQTGQWGSLPFSAQPTQVARVERYAGGGGLRIAETGGSPVGALIVGDCPYWAPEVTERELYVILLVTSRRHAGQGVGTALVAHAADEARQGGAALLRVDCWAGAPDLVAWYEREGFVRCDTFEVRGWRGQVLEMRLTT